MISFEPRVGIVFSGLTSGGFTVIIPNIFYIKMNMVTLAAILMVRIAFESIGTTAPVPWTIVRAMTDTVILACITSFIFFFFFFGLKTNSFKQLRIYISDRASSVDIQTSNIIL